jgi:hypothetical protein
MLDNTDMIGSLVIPKNYQQALLQHGRALVLAAGPKAQEQGIEAGAIIHCSEVWGEKFVVNGKAYKVGRSRDINGLCPGERIADTGKYLD